MLENGNTDVENMQAFLMIKMLTNNSIPTNNMTKITKSNQIKIATWDAAGIKNKLNELHHFLNDKQIDILLVTETRLTPKITCKIPNYRTIRNEIPTQTISHGGVAILINDTIKYDSIPHFTNHTNLQSVEITVYQNQLHRINVFAAYISPDKKNTLPRIR